MKKNLNRIYKIIGLFLVLITPTVSILPNIEAANSKDEAAQNASEIFKLIIEDNNGSDSSLEEEEAICVICSEVLKKEDITINPYKCGTVKHKYHLRCFRLFRDHECLECNAEYVENLEDILIQQNLTEIIKQLSTFKNENQDLSQEIKPFLDILIEFFNLLKDKDIRENLTNNNLDSLKIHKGIKDLCETLMHDVGCLGQWEVILKYIKANVLLENNIYNEDIQIIINKYIKVSKKIERHQENNFNRCIRKFPIYHFLCLCFLVLTRTR